MATRTSIRRSVPILLSVIPIFAILAFPFRDSYIDPEATYLDVELTSEWQLAEGDSMRSASQIFWKALTRQGDSFTGTVTQYYRKSGAPIRTLTFKNGIRLKEEHYDSTGSVDFVIEYSVDFEEMRIESQKSYRYGIPWVETTYLPPIFSNNYRVSLFDSSGNLKRTLTNYNWPDSAVSTEYDFEGNITFQEHYANGQLVEKIK